MKTCSHRSFRKSLVVDFQFFNVYLRLGDRPGRGKGTAAKKIIESKRIRELGKSLILAH